MSVFNCNITYNKIPGDSYGSTKNRLISQGFVDKFNNIKNIAKFRLANSELSQLASVKLGREVRLYAEKRLLNGVRAIPDMKLFGMLDQLNKSTPINEQPTLTPLINKPVEQQVYERLGQKVGSLIDSSQLSEIQPLIDEYNQLNTGKTIGLMQTKVEGKYLINTEYKANYLYTGAIEMPEAPDYQPTDSNNNFNSPCIK